jgi:hypothetical protein
LRHWLPDLTGLCPKNSAIQDQFSEYPIFVSFDLLSNP